MARRRGRRKRSRGRHQLLAVAVVTAATVTAIWFLWQTARPSSRVTFRLPTPAPHAPAAGAESITEADRQRLEEALDRSAAANQHGSPSKR